MPSRRGRAGGGQFLGSASVIRLLALLVAAGPSSSSLCASLGPPPTAEPVGDTVGPAANGLIAYGSGGDIAVGDPVTGASTAITTGPESDINPKFSPDGSRIAFVRSIRGPASLIVVNADGSDERIVVSQNFGASSDFGIGPFAWTPDGHGIVVEVDFPPRSFPHGDGEIGLFDASGVREPRLLVPPLTAWVGGIYFGPSVQVAPMFRPPDGDLILSQTLQVFDADLDTGGPARRRAARTRGRLRPDLVTGRRQHRGLAWFRVGDLGHER